MPIDKKAQKEALKEAINEWLNEVYAEVGKWTLRGLLAALFGGAAYLYMLAAGWHK